VQLAKRECLGLLPAAREQLPTAPNDLGLDISSFRRRSRDKRMPGAAGLVAVARVGADDERTATMKHDQPSLPG